MFTLPDLPYPYDALEPYIDEQTMMIHHDKHHAAYVKNLNDALAGNDKLLAMHIDKLLTNLDIVPDASRVKVRNNGGGHANHTFFWSIMAPGAGAEPSGHLKTALDAKFGSFTSFREKFSSAALGRFGSGWAWLVAKGKELEITDTPNQDSPLMQSQKPIVGIDVWEHAYYLKYQNMRADYIQAWWNVVNWTEVEKRFAAL